MSETNITDGQPVVEQPVINELLSQDLEGICLFNGPEEVFTAEELKAIKTKRILKNATEAQTLAEQWSLKVNSYLRNNRVPFTASVIDMPDGSQQLFIIGKVNQDIVYITSDAATAHEHTSYPDTIAFTSNKFGMQAANHKILSLDGLINHFGTFSDRPIMPTEILITKQKSEDIPSGHANDHSYYNNSQQPKQHSVATSIPDSIDHIGSLFHELGHFLGQLQVNKSYRGEMERKALGLQYDEKTKKRKILLFGPRASDNEIQQYKVKEERNAWAYGRHLLKTLGRKVGLSVVTDPYSTEIQKQGQESALTTYQNYSFYSIPDHTASGSVSAYSQKARKEARELHHRLEEAEIPYSALPKKIRGKNADPRLEGYDVYDTVDVEKNTEAQLNIVRNHLKKLQKKQMA